MSNVIICCKRNTYCLISNNPIQIIIGKTFYKWVRRFNKLSSPAPLLCYINFFSALVQRQQEVLLSREQISSIYATKSSFRKPQIHLDVISGKKKTDLETGRFSQLIESLAIMF